MLATIHLGIFTLRVLPKKKKKKKLKINFHLQFSMDILLQRNSKG